MDATLEAKLREMIDRQEIWQVMLRYSRGLDRFDRELVKSCYFDDAIEDHFNFVGSVDDFIDYANASSDLFVSCQHGLMNHCCDLQGDNAYCETYYLFTGVSKKAPHLLSQGRYVDHFQRRNGEWRIANRVAIVEGTFDLSDSQITAAFVSPFKREEMQTASRDRNDVSYHRPPRPRAPRQPT
jgi:ketosteroid isomerase-like protein